MRLCFRMSLFWVCSGLDTTQSFIFWIINALLHLHIIMLGKCKIQSERVGENIAALMSTSIRNKAECAKQLRRIQKVFIIHLRVFGQISWKVIHHIPSIPAAGGHCEQRQVWCWMWTWIIEVAGGIEDWRLLSAGGQHLCSVLGTGTRAATACATFAIHNFTTWGQLAAEPRPAHGALHFIPGH